MAVCAASAAAGNGTLREGDAELEELGMDAWCTPEGIRRGHAPDQSPDRGVDGRATSGRAAREKRPVRAKATPLPPPDSVRVTITRDSFHPAQTLANPTQKTRSRLRSGGRVTVRLYTASC